MFCPKCGTQAEADAAFCKSCGKSLGSPNENQVTNTQTQVHSPPTHPPDLLRQLTTEHPNSKTIIKIAASHFMAGVLCLWFSRDSIELVTGWISRNLAGRIDSLRTSMMVMGFAFIFCGLTFLYNHNKPEKKDILLGEQVFIVLLSVGLAYYAAQIARYPMSGGGVFWMFLLLPVGEIVYLYKLTQLDDSTQGTSSSRKNWVCKGCGTTNSSFYLSTCSKCKLRYDAVAPNSTHGDWQCKKCNFNNSAISGTCGYCGMGKTDWLCPKCDSVNSSSDSTCAQCAINASMDGI